MRTRMSSASSRRLLFISQRGLSGTGSSKMPNSTAGSVKDPIIQRQP